MDLRSDDGLVLTMVVEALDPPQQGLFRGHSRSLAVVNLSLPDPFPQGLRVQTQLTRRPVTTPWLRLDSLRASRTIRTARSRTSGAYRRWLGWPLLAVFDVDM